MARSRRGTSCAGRLKHSGAPEGDDGSRDGNEERNSRQYADRLGRADRDGRRHRAARRRVSSRRRRQVSGHPQLRALCQGTVVPGRLQGQLGAAGQSRRPRCCKARATSIRTGSWSIRRNGCRTAMSACASIHAAPDARPASSTCGRRAKRKISISASNGRARNRGATAKSASTASPITPMNQWTVGALKPPHLAALCIWEGSSDYYRELCRHGGILSDFLNSWHPRQVGSVQHGLGERGAKSAVTGEAVAGPDTLPMRSSPRIAPTRRAKPSGASSVTIITPRAPPIFRRSRRRCSRPPIGAAWGCTPAAISRVICPPAPSRNGSRCTATRISPTSTATTAKPCRRRFFGHFLKGEDTGWERQPRVALNIRHPGEKFVLRAENEWPLARTQWTKYFLQPDGLALTPQADRRRLPR